MAAVAKESTNLRVIGLDLLRNAQVMARHEWNGHLPHAPKSAMKQATAAVIPIRLDELDLLGGTDPDFALAIDRLKDELAPEGWLERFVADQIVLSFVRLRASAISQSQGGSVEECCRLDEAASRCLHDAIAQLTQLQSRRRSQWGKAMPMASRPLVWDDESDAECDAHVFPASGSADGQIDDLPIVYQARTIEDLEKTAPSVHQRRASRLLFDDTLSADSPVIQGTQITASHIVSMVIDGLCWQQILERHPELVEDDIRACLDYTLDQEGPIHLGEHP